MKEKIRKHIEEYNKKNHWGTTEEDLIETIKECGKILHEEHEDRLRWWDEYSIVKDIDGMLISYVDAKTTGDRSPNEVGFEFDPNTIIEVKEVKETQIVTTYEPID